LHNTEGVLQAYWQQYKLNLHQYPSPVAQVHGNAVVPILQQLSNSMHKHSFLEEQPIMAGKSVYKAEKQQQAAAKKVKLLGSISAIFVFSSSLGN
jgi:hypothetical protein